MSEQRRPGDQKLVGPFPENVRFPCLATAITVFPGLVFVHVSHRIY